MPLTPQDVHSKVFGPTRFRRGYDEAEVDAFLDEVEAELNRLHREIDSLRSQVGSTASGDVAETNAIPAVTADEGHAAEVSPAPAVVPTAASPAVEPVGAADTGMFAKAAPAAVAPAAVAHAANDDGLEQQVARALVLAQRAADEAVRDAETHAEQLRRDAAGEAERIRREAAEQTERERREWEQSRSQAEDDVEQLRAFEREYRTRLRAYLEHQLRELEQARTQVEDGDPEPLSGSRPLVTAGTSAEAGSGPVAGQPGSGLPTSELPAEDPASVPPVPPMPPLAEAPATPPSVVIPDYSVPSGVGDSASGDELRQERRDLHDGL
jgi:DivIVA domain-containing protein